MIAPQKSKTLRHSSYASHAAHLRLGLVVLGKVHESLPRDLLFHSLDRCGEMRVLDVQIFYE